MTSSDLNGGMRSRYGGIVSQIKDEPWHIETLISPEHQSEAHRRLEYLKLMPKLALFCLLSDCLYLGYRVLLAVQAPRAKTSVYALLAMEICFAAAAGLLHLQSFSAWGKAKFKLPLRLRGDRLPTVDVFLPCCGEELEVIMDTVRAACALDYPPESYRVVVLDDGGSKLVQDSVERLSREQAGRNLYYASRDVKARLFSKNGNMNFGLEFVAGLPSGPSDFVAVLDIDMIPLPFWLRAVLPYLVSDSKVGLASPSQRFYNIPNGDPFFQSLDLLSDGVETIKDCVSSSWCTGTGFVVRRSALDQIHWFPMQYSSQDIATSAKLTAVGWKIEYVPEKVQWGLAPDTFNGHAKQRSRWTADLFYTIAAYWGDREKGDATMQVKLGSTIVSIAWLPLTIITSVSIVAIPWVLSTGSPTVVYQSPRQLQILLHLESLSFFAAILCGFTRSRSTRSHGEVMLDWQRVGLIPSKAATIIRLTMSEFFGIKTQSFAPSSGSANANRPGWFESLTHQIDAASLAHIFIFSAQLAGGYAGLRAIMTADQDESLIRYLFSGAGYPTFFLLWVKYLLHSGIPIPLLISSQSIWPERESLLVRDPVSKVAYPSEEATNPLRIRMGQPLAKVAFCYHCIVLVSAWFIR